MREIGKGFQVVLVSDVEDVVVSGIFYLKKAFLRRRRGFKEVFPFMEGNDGILVGVNNQQGAVVRADLCKVGWPFGFMGQLHP